MAKKIKKPAKIKLKKPAAPAKPKSVKPKVVAKKKMVASKVPAAKVKAAKPEKKAEIKKPVAPPAVMKPAAPAPAKKAAPPAKKIIVEEKPQKAKVKEQQAKGAEAPAEAQAEEAAEIVLTDSEGRRFCRVKDCDQVATVDGYCRFHYLQFWKKIQVRKKILSEGKLERYIEDLTARYPDKFLDMLRKDLRSEKEFLAAIQELEIDESAVENEFSEDETQTYIDEVRGMSEAAPVREEEDF